MSLEETERTLSWIIDCYDANRHGEIKKFSVGVSLKDGGELIGWCGLGPLEVDPSEIELYYGISGSHWGRGYATEAAGALLGYGFDPIGLERVVAVVKPENVASRRVLEKIGMAYVRDVTGLPEKHRFFEGSRYFALTREEWMRR